MSVSPSKPEPRPGVEPGPAPSDGAMISDFTTRAKVDRGGSRTLICRVQAGRLPVGRHAQVPSVAPVGVEPTVSRLRGGCPAGRAARPIVSGRSRTCTAIAGGLRPPGLADAQPTRNTLGGIRTHDLHDESVTTTPLVRQGVV